jgi:DNA-directed RNA polymerase specialized sigma24 family protein
VGRQAADGAAAPDDGALFAELYPGLRRFAAVVRPAEVDADDLVQDALTRTLAVRSLAACDDPGAYLRTAILRLAANHRRSLGRRRRALTRLNPPEGASPTYPSDLDDLRRLAPVERAVLYLSVVEGRSFGEIGALIGSSEQAARARSSRALKRLRIELTTEHREIADA